MKNISIIVAIAENRAIGKNNQLLWHLPEDLKRFKKITSGNTVIMGKKTWESLPIKPLPNRKNIVISDNLSDTFQGCSTTYSIEEAVKECNESGENFIIGGGSVYKQFLPYAQKLYITLIHKKFEADTFFPEIDLNEWNEIERSEIFSNPAENFSYSFIIYQRKL